MRPEGRMGSAVPRIAAGIGLAAALFLAWTDVALGDAAVRWVVL